MTFEKIDDRGDLWFPPGYNHRTYKRREPIRHIVLHWTGGLRDAAGVHQTLTKRKLSVGYVSEPDGDLIQMADDSTRCSHATHLSDTSIGIENVGLGYSKWRPSKFTHRKWPGQTFEKYKCTVDGRTIKAIGFTKVQMDTIVDFCNLKCLQHNIPRQFPSMERVPRRLVKKFARNFSGVLGHFHVSMKGNRWSKGKGTKWDPGTQIFARLAAEGFVEVPVRSFLA